MRTDATFIGIEVEEGAAADATLAAALAESCPVDRFADAPGCVHRLYAPAVAP